MSTKPRCFKVLEKPHPSFPSEPGGIICSPTLRYEWCAKDGLHETILDHPGYFKEVEWPGLQEKESEQLSLDTIRDDYQKFGYLTSEQVEWLMDKLEKIHIMVYLEWEDGTPSNKLSEIEKIIENRE